MIAFRDRVRFGETDTMGVVHHVKYFHWYEMGRVKYLTQAGFDVDWMLHNNIHFPIVDLKMSYKASCKYDDEYEVQVGITDLNRARMDFICKIYRVADWTLVAEGSSRNLFTDATGKVTRLEAKWYNPLEKMYKEHKEKAGW